MLNRYAIQDKGKLGLSVHDIKKGLGLLETLVNMEQEELR